MSKFQTISKLNDQIISCKKCTRLSKYIKLVSKNKVRRFQNETYWGRPLPGFGDINAEILIVGLAPAAHGGNRTGRMFTGDSSGDWLAKVLYENEFANQPSSKSKNDGLELYNVYITAAVRCAPPQNKPLNEEIENCLPYLQQELVILKKVKIIVCLGKIAFETVAKLLKYPKTHFSHGYMFKHKRFFIICSYHPSRQNTQTGRLTWSMWDHIFKQAKKQLSSHSTIKND